MSYEWSLGQTQMVRPRFNSCWRASFDSSTLGRMSPVVDLTPQLWSIQSTTMVVYCLRRRYWYDWYPPCFIHMFKNKHTYNYISLYSYTYLPVNTHTHTHIRTHTYTFTHLLVLKVNLMSRWIIRASFLKGVSAGFCWRALGSFNLLERALRLNSWPTFNLTYHINTQTHTHTWPRTHIRTLYI